jgi:hypothetical protein
MATCAVDLFGPIPGGVGKLLAVGECESHLNPHAVSASGTYRGLMQYGPLWENYAADAFWRPRWGRRGVDVPSVFNGRAQLLVTVQYVRAHGWGAWSCA